MKQKKPWKNDVAVLSIFFARPAIFRESFECIRKARPRILLLWQDGPREGRADDISNIEECRKIAENIDWECEIYRNYHEKNMGCDPSTHYSHKWAFSIVDKCIILEDDVLPTQSFFKFCQVLLDKYENDYRIDRICGLNLLGKYNTGYDYFFARTGSSTGWASWRRVANSWDSNYEYLEDEYTLACLRENDPNSKHFDRWLKVCKQRKSSGIPYWEDIVGARTLMQQGLVIYPTKNMILNNGIGENSTHTPNDISQISKYGRRLYTIETYEYKFPLNHPHYMIADDYYLRKCTESLRVPFILRIIERAKRVTVKKILNKLGLS